MVLLSLVWWKMKSTNSKKTGLVDPDITKNEKLMYWKFYVNYAYDKIYSNALSFYRSQNVLCRSKFFEPAKNLTAFSASSKPFVLAQKPILLNANHLLCLVLLQVTKCFLPVQIVCVGPKIYLYNAPVTNITNILYQTKRWFAFSKIGFWCRHKSFWRGTKCSQIFGLAQKICTGTKHFGTCKRTRH